MPSGIRHFARRPLDGTRTLILPSVGAPRPAPGAARERAPPATRTRAPSAARMLGSASAAEMGDGRAEQGAQTSETTEVAVIAHPDVTAGRRFAHLDPREAGSSLGEQPR